MSGYPTHSSAVSTIVKGLTLTRSLYVSSILIGEPHTGKRSLVAHLFPDLPRADGRDHAGVISALAQTDALIIEHYEQLPYPENIDLEGKHIIAIAEYAANPKTLDDQFAFLYTMPPLRERLEDVDLYAQHYQDEAEVLFGLEGPVTLVRSRLDLRRNHQSLRASVFREVLFQHADREMFEWGLYHYFHRHLPEESRYHHHLSLLERPLLRAGLERYESQLKLAEALGINRNTLRKKIREHLPNDSY